jgi:hypothetical protein
MEKIKYLTLNPSPQERDFKSPLLWRGLGEVMVLLNFPYPLKLNSSFKKQNYVF